jgi:hypothetical protein
MKMKFSAIAALLLGCTLFVSGLGSAEEIMTCGGSTPKAALKSKATAPGIAIRKADKNDWTYKVTNTGNVKLTNVRVTDKHFTDISCQQDALDAGESMGCTASGPTEAAVSASTGCAVADHVVFNEAGVSVTTQGDCVAETH